MGMLLNWTFVCTDMIIEIQMRITLLIRQRETQLFKKKTLTTFAVAVIANPNKRPEIKGVFFKRFSWEWLLPSSEWGNLFVSHGFNKICMPFFFFPAVNLYFSQLPKNFPSKYFGRFLLSCNLNCLKHSKESGFWCKCLMQKSLCDSIETKRNGFLPIKTCLRATLLNTFTLRKALKAIEDKGKHLWKESLLSEIMNNSGIRWILCCSVRQETL